MRAAIYFTPSQDDPLTVEAGRWLGRDAFDGTSTRAADPEIDVLVTDPARYGFHATLKAPFRLMDGRSIDILEAALADFAETLDAVHLGNLSLTRIGGFLALTPAASHELAGLEEAIRETFEPFRAPLSEAEIARRKPDQLSERQRENLRQWGYPHVGADFRFHMTLTNSLDEPALSRTEDRLRSDFAHVLERPVIVDALALFVEPAQGAPFIVHSRHSLRVPAFS
jgi:putative phosphonate metabolism protein